MADGFSSAFQNNGPWIQFVGVGSGGGMGGRDGGTVGGDAGGGAGDAGPGPRDL
jgi:hypothetical protein